MADLALVQENPYALFRAVTALPDGELVESDKLCWHCSFPPSPAFRGVYERIGFRQCGVRINRYMWRNG
jgi:hypothetical protein